MKFLHSTFQSRQSQSSSASRMNYISNVQNIRDPQKRADAYDLEGNVLFAEGHFYDALNRYQQALYLRQSNSFGQNSDLRIAESYRNIGAVYYKMNNFTLSLRNHEMALSIRERTLGRNNLLTSDSYENIGVVYRSLGNTKKALEYLEIALQIRKQLDSGNYSQGAGMKLKVATSFYDIGTVYRDMGDLQRAYSYHKEALQIRQSYLHDANNQQLIESTLAVRELEASLGIRKYY
ncbi:MAG: tetratricopeptide repeat protein [Candidatus Caenarcaniphilales bacterium]|nr:tetratricopeptide repeat protein [Candidatus Caenarcaniphilales bacterium]